MTETQHTTTIRLYLWVTACVALALVDHYLDYTHAPTLLANTIVVPLIIALAVYALGLRLGGVVVVLILLTGYLTSNYTLLLEPPKKLATYTALTTTNGKVRVPRDWDVQASVGQAIRVEAMVADDGSPTDFTRMKSGRRFRPVSTASSTTVNSTTVSSTTVSSIVVGRGVPLVSHLLRKRYDLANRLYYDSGGEVFTAQSHLFGYRSFIPEPLRDMYIVTGLSHLLAQSGLHVGIMVALFFLARRLTNWRLLEIVALVLVPMIIPLSAFSVTVTRATLFALSYMFCRLLGYRVYMVPFTLLWGGIFILWNRGAIFDTSFQMSFMAVLGISLFLSRGNARNASGVLVRTIHSTYVMVLVGLAATIFTTPIQLYSFGTTNYASVLTTLILTPIVTLQIFLGVLMLLTPSWLSVPAILPGLYFLERANSITMDYLYHLTYPLFIVSSLPLWGLVLIYVVSAGLFFTRYGILSVMFLLTPYLWGMYTTHLPAGTYSNSPRVVFYNMGSSKGFAGLTPTGESYVYYSGTISSFRYRFLPEVAKFHTKVFDYGDVRIYGEPNYYLRIKSALPHDFPICVNSKFSNLSLSGQPCRVNFVTRSNSLTRNNTVSGVSYIIYNNSHDACNILEYKDLPQNTHLVLNYSQEGFLPPPPCN